MRWRVCLSRHACFADLTGLENYIAGILLDADATR